MFVAPSKFNHVGLVLLEIPEENHRVQRCFLFEHHPEPNNCVIFGHFNMFLLSRHQTTKLVGWWRKLQVDDIRRNSSSSSTAAVHSSWHFLHI